MIYSHFISNIHLLPVLVMTLFSFALGAFWHSQKLFGKTWAEENNLSKDRKINAPLIFGGTALVHFVTIAGLSAVVAEKGFLNGLLGGILISIVWILPSITGTYLFAGKSLKLLAIDAGMYIVLFSIAGGIMGVW